MKLGILASLVVLFLGSQAFAELRAELVFPSPMQGRVWELLRVQSDDVGPGSFAVTVQDGRAIKRGGEAGGLVAGCGLRVMRKVKMTPDQEGHYRLDTLMPLPLVAPAELAGDGGEWPVRVTLERMDDGQGDAGQVGKRTLVASRIVRVALAEAAPQFRILVPRGGTLQGGVLLPPLERITALPVRVAVVSDEELLTGPALLAAGADAVLAPPSLPWTQERATALMNAGVQLIVPGDAAPGGTFSRLVWDQLTAGPAGGDGGTANDRGWICPASPLKIPSLVEPGLVRVSHLSMPAGPAPEIRWTLLALGPAGLVGLLLARGIFRRSPWVAVAAAVALSGVTVGMIAALKAEDVPSRKQVAWQVIEGSPQAVGGLAVSETVTTERATFAKSFEDTAGGGGANSLLLPLVGSVREYLELQDMELDVDDPCRLAGGLAARRPMSWITKQVRVRGLMPPLPQTPEERRHFQEITGIPLARGAWIAGGYVRGDEGGGGGGRKEAVVFDQWLQGASREAGEAWYESRFEAGHRYFTWPADDPRQFQVIDFGADPATQP